ncbi:hypothetical protein LCGC14_1641600 [marine sediment metagenome]|uniref:Uncharacterized protein n=1 Tax=marine sediment metagenome TaxID=412755 RepID=A0A0F9ILY2_9ZZZZ
MRTRAGPPGHATRGNRPAPSRVEGRNKACSVPGASLILPWGVAASAAARGPVGPGRSLGENADASEVVATG